MKIWPGHPYPLGATYDGTGTNFSRVLRGGRAGRAVPVRRRRGRDPPSTCPRSRRSAGTATCRTSARASATASGSTARTTPPTACAATRPSCCSTPTPRRSTATVEWDESMFGYHFDDPDGAAQRRRQRRPPAQGGGHQPVLRLGQRPPAATPPGTRRSSTRSTSRASPRTHPDIPRGAAGHLRRPGHPAGHRLLQAARRHRRRAAAGAPVRPRRAPGRPGPAQLLGLQLDRLPRAPQRVLVVGHAGPAGAGVQADGADAARRRHRGDPRRGLQPHRRGQPPRPDAVVQGHRQRRLLPADARRPALLHGLHGHRQHPEHAPPARAAADHGQPALLGDRDARRRLPLRPGLHPGPRAARRRPAVAPSSTSSSRTRSSAR